MHDETDPVDGTTPAREVFELVAEEPPTRSRIVRLIGALTLGALTAGAGPTNPGGRSLVIRDRRTGERLVEWPDRMFDDAHVEWGRIEADLGEMDADQFAVRWIEGQATST